MTYKVWNEGASNESRSDKIHRAARLAREGMCNESIARELGVTYGAVCHYIHEARKAGVFVDRLRDWYPLYLTLIDRNGYELADEAARRNISVTQLAQQIIDTVVRENLFDAVLERPVKKKMIPSPRSLAPTSPRPPGGNE